MKTNVLSIAKKIESRGFKVISTSQIQEDVDGEVALEGAEIQVCDDGILCLTIGSDYYFERSFEEIVSLLKAR